MTKFASIVCGALAGAGLMSGAAGADCFRQNGYMYTYFTCVGGSFPCDDNRFADMHQVMIISNVFYDNGSNGDYPSSVFFDELQIQANLTVNGQESICYNTADEAQRAQRDHIARHMRMNQRQQVFRISMPNT